MKLTRGIVAIAGGVLIAIGMLGFVAASVGLSEAKKIPDLKSSSHQRLELSEDSPVLAARRRQAENLLLGSLLLGGLGLVTLLASWRMASGETSADQRGRP